MNILVLMNEFPPVACRILARCRRGRRALTSRDISAITGLDRITIDRLSVQTSWDNISVSTAIRFAIGCGVNHLSNRRNKELLHRGKLTHILTAPPQQQEYLTKLAGIYNKWLKGSALESGPPASPEGDTSCQREESLQTAL